MSRNGDDRPLYDRLVELVRQARAEPERSAEDAVDAYLGVDDFRDRLYVKRLIRDDDGDSDAYLHEDGVFHVRNWTRCRADMKRNGIVMGAVFGSDLGPITAEFEPSMLRTDDDAREVAAIAKMARHHIARNRFGPIACDADPAMDVPDLTAQPASN